MQFSRRHLKMQEWQPFLKKIIPKFLPITALYLCYQFLVSYGKCMYSRLYSFLFKYKIRFKRQFLFRSNHSTIHALISLVDLIRKHLDNDYFVCGIFIDLQKAFDTVNHYILLAKLAHYGVVDWLIAGSVPF